MTIKVKYENGVLKVLEKVKLEDNRIYEIELIRKVEDSSRWEEFVVDEFFKGYSEKDEIYDKL